MYIAGNFETVAGKAIKYIAKWDGVKWDSVGSSVTASHIVCTEVYRDTLYAGIFGGELLKLDNNNWKTLLKANGSLVCMKPTKEGLYIGGYFDSVNNAGCNNIFLYKSGKWEPLGSGVDDAVETIEEYRGNIYAGGWFTHAGGIPASYIAVWGDYVGVKEQEEQQPEVHIFPNPNSGKAVFDFGSETAKVEVRIYSMAGELIFKSAEFPRGSPCEVDLNGLEPELYTYLPEFKNRQVTRKLVVDRR